MPQSKTIMGKAFNYSGSLQAGLVVHKRVDVAISTTVIQFIRDEIDRRSPVRMGACRDNPSPGSVGEALLKKLNASPQNLSYVVPLLIADGFCTANRKKPIVITRTR